MRKRKKRSDERQSEEADEHQEMCRGEEQREVEHAHRAHGGEDDHPGQRRKHLVIINNTNYVIIIIITSHPRLAPRNTTLEPGPVRSTWAASQEYPEE